MEVETGCEKVVVSEGAVYCVWREEETKKQWSAEAVVVAVVVD